MRHRIARFSSPPLSNNAPIVLRHNQSDGGAIDRALISAGLPLS
jgi:hypothetical protein